MKTKITLALFILFSLHTVAQVGTIFKEGDLRFKVSSETTVELSDGTPTSLSGAVIIPLTVNYNAVSYNVTRIGSSAFNNCTGITAVTIPNSITRIADRSFANCTGLTSVVIPNSVTSIGDSAFYLCSSLTSITIPSSVSSIGLGAFSFCSGLTSVAIPDSVTSLGAKTFAFCESLTEVSIPNSVSSIGDRTFEYCYNLKAVNIPDSVTSIGNYAFGSCKSLNSVSIANTVTSIGQFAFFGCINLNSIAVYWTKPLAVNSTIFESVPLSNITLNVPTGTEAAYKAADVWKEFNPIIEFIAPVVGQKFAISGINYIVTKATVPYEVGLGLNGTTTTGTSGRVNTSVQTGITGEIIIPAAVSISGTSFSVTSILAYAFQNSKGLTAVTLPSSITSIGDFAFQGCSSLTALTVNWTTPIAINPNIFDNITRASITLHVPAGAATAYTAATIWKDFGTITTLGTDNFLTINAVKFYPNPTQSQINFTEEINTLEVFDIAGKKLKSFQNPSTNYDVSTLNKGVYILKGKTADGKSINEKLVKE